MSLQDLRLAAKSLAKRPGYTSVAAATLALGAVVVSTLTVVHAVLLKQRIAVKKGVRL